jgi:hypothetical protein
MHHLKKHEPRLVRHHLESLPPSYTAHWHTTLQSHSRQERYVAYENWKALAVMVIAPIVRRTGCPRSFSVEHWAQLPESGEMRRPFP